MSSHPVDPPFGWLLGRESYQRLCLRFWVMTTSVYVLLVALQAYAASLNLIHATHVQIIGLGAALGTGLFYLCMRTGWSGRLTDPAMTAQQMAFAFFMLSLAYVLIPQLRPTLLIVSPLVLMFGAFTLPPKRCRLLGFFAVVALGLAVVFSVGLRVQGSDPSVELVNFLGAAVVYTMVAEMAGRLSAIRQQLRVQKKELHIALERNSQLARRDELTQLPNRRHAVELLEYELRRNQRDKTLPCLCMIDIDHFKRINDEYGHASGDEVLRLLAKHSSAALRAPDVLARWGGEEFVLLMPDTQLAEGMQVVERLREVLSSPMIWTDRSHLQVTFSAGVAAVQKEETIQQAVARADAALYQAKQRGRNRTVLA